MTTKAKRFRALTESRSRLTNGLKLLGVMALTLLGIFLGAKLALLLLPITLGFLLAQIVEPLIRFLKRHGVSRSWGTVIGMIVLLGVLGTAVGWIITRAIAEISRLIENWPEISKGLYVWLDGLSNSMEHWTDFLHPSISGMLQNLYGMVVALVGDLVNVVAVGLVNCAMRLPSGIVFVIILFLSTILIMRDREKILSFFRRQVPESWMNRVSEVKKDMFSALFGYIRAQLILMCITFAELLVAFSIFRLEYALLFAIVIAVVDALPIFGAGLFLIPTAAYGFLSGNLTMGIQFTVLYLVVLAVRQMIEPRIVGQQIGLHPLVTLAAMYAGLRLAGVAGLILGPVAVLIERNLMGAYMKGRTVSEILDGVGAGGNGPESADVGGMETEQQKTCGMPEREIPTGKEE